MEAIRASYALPGIFEPVRVDGRWLFDGALVNPVPVSVCRSLGADLVIAVNLTADIGHAIISDAMPAADEPARPEPELVTTLAAAPLEAAGDAPAKRRRLTTLRRLFLRRPNGAPGIGSVMMDAFAISQDRISRARLALDPPDVMINARLTTCGSFEFHRAAALIDHGRLAARRAIPAIEAALAAQGKDKAKAKALDG